MRTRRCRTILVIGISLLLAGCEPADLSGNGVIGVFGELGLQPGAFSYPRGIAVAPGGSVFVVDKTGRVQRFAADGKYESGWRMPETEHGKPIGMSVHPDGRLLVADTHYHRVLIFDRNGKQLGSFGCEGVGDGQFQFPTDVAVDAQGFIYVSEYHLNDRVTKWSPDLRFVHAIGDQPVDGKRLSRPAGLAIDDEQTLWVADACNHRLVRFTLAGALLSSFGRLGSNPGEMKYPYDVSVSPDGSLVVCEYGENRLQWFTKDGRSLRTWGGCGRRPGELFSPWGVAYGPGGLVYVVDSLNNRVQIVRP